MSRITVLWAVVTSVTSLVSFGQEMATPETSTQTINYGVTPEGKTLPAGVARLRLPYQTATGDQTYDKDGNKSDSPVSYKATGGALVVEYGISDKMSFQLKTSYVLKQATKLETSGSGYSALKASTFATQTGGAKNADELAASVRASVIANFKTAGACPDDASCAAAYDSGALKTQADGAVIPGTGSVDAGTAYKDAVPVAAAQIDAAISQAIQGGAENTSGPTLGDTIIGVLYEAYAQKPLFFALAAGLRIPTGNRDIAANELDSTRSAYELGARFNLDVLPLDWFMVSWQNQSEVGIAGTKRKRAGIEEEIERNGVRNVGFIYLKPSFASLSPSLNGLKTSIGVSYDYDSAEVVKVADTETTSARSQQMWSYIGVGYGLLGMGIPLRADLEHEIPMSGKNVSIAVAKTTLTLKAFARF